jgi:Ca-activated chloride channel family protein
VRIAVQTQVAGSGEHAAIANDVTAQVEFNPARVAFYRLVGFDQPRDRNLDQSASAPSAVRAGDAVTVLYEVVPAKTEIGAPATGVVRVSYQRPAGDAQLVQYPLTDSGDDLANASADFKFAAAVAEFAMLLRGSPDQNARTLDSVVDLAIEGRGEDHDGQRAGLIELVRKTQPLTRG